MGLAYAKGCYDTPLAKRLVNLPKVRLWPIEWFEPKEIAAGAPDPAPVPAKRSDPHLADSEWPQPPAYGRQTETDALLVW